MNLSLPEAADLFRRNAGKRVLLATHLNPDGDAIGSVIALGHIAASLACDVRVLLVTGIPAQFAWLPLPWPATPAVSELGSWVPQLLVTADCGDAARCGDELEAFFLHRSIWPETVSCCIDHHIQDRPYADHNWVDPSMSSTSQMAGLLAEAQGLVLSGDLGRAVYLGLVSDTGNFSFSSTTANTLAMAGRIVDAGLDVARFTAAHENNWTVKRMHLWGRLMSEVTLHGGGTVACSIVTRAHLREYGCVKADLEGFAAWPRRIQGVCAVLFVREDADAQAKISLRSMGDIDVRRVAAHFGGGGHAAAAGASVRQPVEKAAAAVLAKLLEAVGQRCKNTRGGVA